MHLGIDPSAFYTSDELDRLGWAVGTHATDMLNNCYVLVEAQAAITFDGAVGFINGAYDFSALSTSNDAADQRVGVSHAQPTASGQFIWVQVYGSGVVRVAASATDDTVLNTTATAGQLDDDGTTGSFDVLGINLTADNGGAAGGVVAQINWPYTRDTANS